jgi:hypothetical protein
VLTRIALGRNHSGSIRQIKVYQMRSAKGQGAAGYITGRSLTQVGR